jgi:hypothetical protein
MNMPEGAIRQKMTMEEFTNEEIDAFLAGKPLPPLPSAVPPQPPAVDDRLEKLEKFAKMKKILPEGAVRQKMTMEGFTAEEIDAFMAGKPLPPKASAAASTAYDPEVYGKYDKLKRIMLPQAIKNKMIMDGISEKDAVGYLGLTTSSTGGDYKVNPSAASKLKPAANVVKVTNKMKSLFWTKIAAADEIKETVWKDIPPYKLTKEQEDTLEQWFSNKPVAAANASSKGGLSSRPGSTNNLASLSSDSADGGGATPAGQSSLRRPSVIKGVSLLDGRRNQNVLIFLGKLRKTPEEIRDMIWAMNPTILTLELTASLRGILPNAEEMQTFNNNTISPDQLDSASRLFAYLVSIPMLATRLSNHEIVFHWFTQHNTLETNLSCLEMACQELISTRDVFHALLSLILSLGNCLNAYTRYGDAQGVQLDILAKLTNLKATSNAKETFLHFLAKQLAEKEPKLLTWSENWKGIWVAGETLQFGQVTKDIQTLERQVTIITADHKKLLKEENFQTKQDNQPYMLRLENFLNDAQTKLADILQKRNKLEEQIKQLLHDYHEEYPSNNAEEDACQKFFATIVTFYRQLLKAHEENIKKQQEMIRKAKIEEEKQRRMDMKATKSATKDLKAVAMSRVNPPSLQAPNTAGPVGTGSGPNTPNDGLGKKTESTKGGDGLFDSNKVVETPQENVFKRFHVSRRLENPTIQSLLASGHLGGISEGILGSGGAKSLLGNTNPISSPSSPSSPTTRLANPSTTPIVNTNAILLGEDSINQFRRKLQNRYVLRYFAKIYFFLKN